MPLTIMGSTSLIAISTLTSEINFYTVLMRLRDPITGLPMFTYLSIQLACKACIEDGKAAECHHMLHLVPRFVSLVCFDLLHLGLTGFGASAGGSPRTDTCDSRPSCKTALISFKASSAAWRLTHVSRFSKANSSTSCLPRSPPYPSSTSPFTCLSTQMGEAPRVTTQS